MRGRRRDRRGGQGRFEALYRLGTEQLLGGSPSEATQPLEEALALDPDHVEAALNLSGAYILTKRFKEALPLLEALARRVPNNPAVWQNLGAARLGNPILAEDAQRRQAISAFERALELDPAARHVAYNIGLIYRDQGDFAQAAAWFAQAVSHDPEDRHARHQLAKLHQRLDDRGRGDGEEDVFEEE